jgi:hypothetical protein
METIANNKYFLELRLGWNGSGKTIYCLQGCNLITGEKIFEKFKTQAEAYNWCKYACGIN